jgi:oligosaccharide repeat unit polymerase
MAASPPSTPSEMPGRLTARQINVLLVQGVIVVLLVGLWLLRSPSESDAAAMVYPLCVLLTALCAWSIWSWAFLTRSWFDFYIMFFSAAAVFNGGQAFLEVLQWNRHGILLGMFGPEVIAQTLFVVLLGLAGLHAGALLAAALSDARRSTDAHAERPAAEDPALLGNLRKLGWAMLAISFPFAVLLLRESAGVVMSAGYGGLYQQNARTGFSAGPQVLSMFLISGALFLAAGGKESRGTRTLCLTVIVLYASVNFFLGYRYYSVIPMLALAWLWHRLIRPLNPYLLLGSALVLLVLIFPLIRAVRTTRGSERMSANFLAERYAEVDPPWIAAIYEMGGSMQTVAYTITLVPSSHEYELGTSYAYAMLTIFPNLFWDVHPAIAHGMPSAWLVSTVDRYTATHGGSLGYSLIAEAYLNFGPLGVPVVLALGGLLYGKFILWANRPGMPARAALAACVACFFVFYAREDAASVARGLVWYAMAPYAAAVWLTARSHRFSTQTDAALPGDALPGASP